LEVAYMKLYLTVCAMFVGCVTAQGVAVAEDPSMVGTQGNSVASAAVSLHRIMPPRFDANADYMSVGPPGAAVRDTSSRPAGQVYVDMHFSHRLRVTLSSSERVAWMTIDDILVGRADTRIVRAEYTLYPWTNESSGMREVWERLSGAPRVLGSDPTGSPINWLSPTSFEWITRSDTLVVHQKADSIFQVTVRARVR
jgi:hypothetical protein